MDSHDRRAHYLFIRLLIILIWYTFHGCCCRYFSTSTTLSLPCEMCAWIIWIQFEISLNSLVVSTKFFFEFNELTGIAVLADNLLTRVCDDIVDWLQTSALTIYRCGPSRVIRRFGNLKVLLKTNDWTLPRSTHVASTWGKYEVSEKHHGHGIAHGTQECTDSFWFFFFISVFYLLIFMCVDNRFFFCIFVFLISHFYPFSSYIYIYILLKLTA